MIVDDARMVGGYLREAMRRAGYHVVAEPKDGREAVRLYSELKPDLVTMDLNMPEVNGVQAIKAIMALDPQAKILVLTALSQSLLEKEVLELGAKGLVSKPIRLKTLMQEIKKILKGSGKKTVKEEEAHPLSKDPT
jgi:two-component system chemotaxis response regulator CheY